MRHAWRRRAWAHPGWPGRPCTCAARHSPRGTLLCGHGPNQMSTLMTEEGPGAALTVVQAAAGALHALLLLALFTEFSYSYRRGARAAGRPTQAGGTDGGRGHFGPRLQARLPRSLQPHIVLMRFIMFDFCLGYTPAVCRFWQGRWPRLPSCWALCGCTIRAARTNLTSLPFRQAACVGPLCRPTSALRHLVASACSTELPRSWFAGDYGPCTAAAGDHSTAGTSVVRAQRHAGVPAGPCDVARQPQPEERPRHRARAPGWPPGSAGYLMSGAPSWWCTTMVLVATGWSQHAGFQPCTSCAPHGAGKQQAAADLLHGCSLLLGTHSWWGRCLALPSLTCRRCCVMWPLHNAHAQAPPVPGPLGLVKDALRLFLGAAAQPVHSQHAAHVRLWQVRLPAGCLANCC